MDLMEFTQGASGNGNRWFVGESGNYLDEITFLDACLEEFSIEESYLRPDYEIIYKGYVKHFDGYGDEIPMEIETGYQFCDKHDEGAFRVYILDENDLVKR